MKPEILAPAGSMEALRAAVYAGADAVYLGGSRFGARAYADNFDEAALVEAIEYCHLYGVKVYLAINTLFRDDEIEQLFDYLMPFYQAGLDAVIVQDLGVMYYVHKNFPDLAIHASTQMTITTGYAYSLLKDYGVTRIVPARELSIEEISRLKQEQEMPEVEVFVQGALCYCYSGQCLMSSMLGGRSGNRGRCAQTCRLPYTVYNEQGRKIKSAGHYVLSPKDLCGLEAVPDLIRAGVDSFKIEGRMKKAEYVAVCVRAYRGIVDAWYQGKDIVRLAEQYKEEMAEVFNRGGFTRGYFYQKNGRKMMSVENPGNVGVEIGAVADIHRNQIRIRLEKDVFKGDILVLDGKKDTITLTSSADGKSGGIIVLNAPRVQEIRKNQKVRRMFQRPLMLELEDYARKERLIPLRGRVELKTGFPAKLIVKLRMGDREYSVTRTGAVGEHADARPLSEEVVTDKIGKTGNTRYYFETLETNLSPDVFYPLKELKELRRSALGELEEMVLADGRRKPSMRQKINIQWKPDEREEGVSVMISSPEQYDGIKYEKRIKDIYLDLQYFEKEAIIEIVSNEKMHGCYIALPAVLRNSSLRDVEEILELADTISNIGFVVRNMDELAFLKKRGFAGKIITDYSLYAMNMYAVLFLRNIYPEAKITLPIELNQKQLSALDFRRDNCEMEVYGYQQLMVSAQCLQNTLKQCDHVDAALVMKDRYHKNFYVSCICRYCYNLIYNGVPSVLFDLVKRDFGAEMTYRLHFTRETREEEGDILEAFFCGKPPECEKTRGHYNRGVE